MGSAWTAESNLSPAQSGDTIPAERGGTKGYLPTDDFAAASHTHAASDVASGTLAHERGGLEADVSAYDGIPHITGGATSQVGPGSAGEVLTSNGAGAAPTFQAVASGYTPGIHGAANTTWGSYTNGIYLSAPSFSDDYTNVAITAGRLYLILFQGPQSGVKVKSLGVAVHVPVASSLVACAIYETTSASNPYPGARVALGGAISTAVAGAYFATISPSITLDPGRYYWFAMVGDSAPTLVGASRTARGTPKFLVARTVGNGINAADCVFYLNSYNYSTGLPDPMTGSLSFEMSGAGTYPVGIMQMEAA